MSFHDEYWNKELWLLIQDRFFDPGTGLVYDYVTSREREKRFEHLPSREEIELNFPNPCGWGTGMEDCALNGGFLLSILRLRNEENSPFAFQAFHGLTNCAKVHGVPGFLSRGISPRDGRSCYINSSRDQFTLAVYGMWSLLFKNDRIAPELHTRGTAFLRSVADYCARTVTEKNRYELLRLDGGRSIVSTMWQCDPHEALRLPMIYGAAYLLTGVEEYDVLMRRYVFDAMSQTSSIGTAESLWDMPLIQLQLSLNFFYESGLLPELRDETVGAMRRNAAFAEKELEGLLRTAESFSGRWDELYADWRLLPMRVREETLSNLSPNAVFDGKTYLNPVFEPRYSRPNELLRGIGNTLGTLALSPDASDLESLVERCERLISRIAISRCTGVGVVPLLFGMLTAHKTLLQIKGAIR